MHPILHPETGAPLEIHGYACRWGVEPAAFRPHALYLDRNVPLNLSHDYGHFGSVGDGALEIWGDAIGLALRLKVTTENAGALAALRAGARWCSVAWDRAVGSDDKISGAALRDICLTDCPADLGTAAWVNTDHLRDLAPSARALHSEYYDGRDACDLVDIRTLKASTALASPSARPLMRRPVSSPSPAAAAALASMRRV